MKCLACGTSNPPDAQTCVSCAEPLSLVCGRCGATVSQASRFCSQCGSPLLGHATGAAPLPGEQSTEKIIAARSALQGERKNITLLFADVKGSTGLIEGLDPEDAEMRLRPTLELLINAVHKYDGTISRIQGDGILALFGAPLAHEDSALRAAYAALEMQEEIQSASDPAIQIRVGLHAGEVFLRAIQNDLSIDYDAKGHNVHVAARMEQLAPPGSIYCTAAVERLTRGFVDAEPLGSFPMKGLSQPIEVFRLVRNNRSRSRWDILSARSLSRFIGRELELRELRAGLASAASGHGQLIAIIGEPGTGKSRLVHEFMQNSEVEPWTIIKASASLQNKNTPYLLFGEVLRHWWEIGEGISPEELKRCILQKMGEFGEPLAAHAPALQTLCGVAADDLEWSELEPATRRQRMITAVADVLLAAARQNPLLLWLEDLHWTDAESIALLNVFIPKISSARLLSIATFRPSPDIQLDKPSRVVRLGPLAPWATDSLLKELVGSDQPTQQLRSLIAQRTGGTPFFIEEIVRSLVESGALAGKLGAYRLVQELPDITIPDSVQAVLAARVDRLPSSQKTLLQSAAVLGPTFSLERFVSISEIPELQIKRRLVDLQAAHFIQEVGDSNQARFAFVHALTHEVVYRSLPLRMRQQLHSTVFQALQRQHEQAFEAVEELAHHADSAGLWREAVSYLRKAGQKAIVLSAYRDAHVFFERALQALARLPEDRNTVEEGIDIRLDLRATFGATGEYERLQVCLSEAEVLAGSVGDRRRLGTVYVAQTLAYNLRGDLSRSIETGTRAKLMAEEINDERLRLVASLYLAQAHMWRGEFRSLLDLLETNVSWMTGPLRYERMITTSTSSVLWQGMVAASHAYLGDFEKAIAAVQGACALAEETRRPYDIALASWYAGFVHSHRGDFERAVDLLRQAMALCVANQLNFLLPVVATSYGYAQAQTDRISEGLELLSKAVAGSRAAKFYYAEAWSSIYLGYSKMRAGAAKEALDLAGRSLQLAREYGYRAAEAGAFRLTADALRVLSAAAHEVEKAYLDSLALASELELHPDVARCKAALSTFYHLNSRPVEAEQMAHSAAEMQRRMGLMIADDGMQLVNTA